MNDIKAALEKSGAAKAAPARRGADLLALLRDERVRQQMALALPRHVSVDRMLRVALTEVRRTPALQSCTQDSVLGSLMLAAQLGLEPGGPLGHAYLIPYQDRQRQRSECQLIIGYRGLIELARRSGQISSIEARAVYEGDKFVCRYGLEPELKHEPAWDDPDRANPDALRYVYAIARLRDGGVQYEVMSRREILAVRAQSRASTGPWQSHFVEMALKTVLRRLCKLLPLSIELATAISVDEGTELGLPQQELPAIQSQRETQEPRQQEEQRGDAEQVAEPAAG